MLTLRENPFDYLLCDWATHLPIDYPSTLAAQLQPYRTAQADAGIQSLAWELWDQVQGETTAFLPALNQRIYSECRHILREKGDPSPAGLTWQRKTGSCRDLTLVLMEACRAVGLAAGFVSSYQVGPPLQENLELQGTTGKEPAEPVRRHLHAWAEVYLPGAGWRGFDPTQGLAVADGHAALAASAYPKDAGPIYGHWLGRGVHSKMDYTIHIEAESALQSQAQLSPIS